MHRTRQRPAPEEDRVRALSQMAARERLLLPGYKVWGYKNHFAKGFLLTRPGVDYAPGEDWSRHPFGPWQVQLDPLVEYRTAAAGAHGVLVLGHAFDESGPPGRERVATRILQALTSSPDRAVSRQSVDEVVAWLSGRYVVLVRRGGDLDVYGDPMATRSVYWHRGPAGVALASHTAILAELAGGLRASRMNWVLGHADYASPFGRWLPGLITPHDDVGQVYANGRLIIEADQVRHERFFPMAQRSELPTAQAGEIFRVELQQQIRNWISVAPLTVLALTAGRDSQAVLEAGLVDLRAAEALTLTYHPFHIPGKSTYADLATANRRAAAAGLPHLVLDVGVGLSQPMRALYGRTFPTWQRYANLARALYLGAPARAATLFGVGGGLVTGMIRDRSVRQITPQLLARKYAYSAFADDPRLHQVFADWIEHTDFTVAALRGYDFYDFFHWEHRLSKWGASGYAEYDLATIPAPVLNSRRLLVTALSLPYPARESGVLYRAISEGAASGP